MKFLETAQKALKRQADELQVMINTLEAGAAGTRAEFMKAVTEFAMETVEVGDELQTPEDETPELLFAAAYFHDLLKRNFDAQIAIEKFASRPETPPKIVVTD